MNIILVYCMFCYTFGESQISLFLCWEGSHGKKELEAGIHGSHEAGRKVPSLRGKTKRDYHKTLFRLTKSININLLLPLTFVGQWVIVYQEV